MKTDDIRSMAVALQAMEEAKLDKVDKKAVKGDFDDRDDKDIDNDGDTDSTDKYLHKRRKAVTKAVSKGGKTGKETEVETQVQEAAPKVKKALADVTVKGIARRAEKMARDRKMKKEAHGMDHVTEIHNDDEVINEISQKKIDDYREKAYKDQPAGDDGSRKYKNRSQGRWTAHLKQTGRAKVNATKESVEQIDELSKKTLGRYVDRASQNKAAHDNDDEQAGNAKNALYKMSKGGDDSRMKQGAKSGRSREVGDMLRKGQQDANNHLNTVQQNAQWKSGKRKAGIKTAMKKLTKETFLDRYKAKVNEEAADKVAPQPADKVQASKEVKQSAEKSVTPDTSKLDRKTNPKETDGTHAIKHNDDAENKSQAQATSSTVKEDLALIESYIENNARYVKQLSGVSSEIVNMVDTLISNHEDAVKAQDRIEAAYNTDKRPSDADRVIARGKLYDCKFLVRRLEDIRDELEIEKRSENNSEVVATRESKVMQPETRIPVSMRDAFAMMEEREMHYKGATKPEGMDDKWSGEAKAFANTHKLATPAETDVNKAMDANKKEVAASLQRSVDYRHNDQQIGDKKPVGNDGK